MAAYTNCTLDKKLGRGSYGEVFSTIDQNGKIGAVKIIETNEKGIQSMLELSIMQIYNHECLNNSIGIDTRNGKTFIAQELADRDLDDEVKRELPSLEKHRLWCHQISQGVNCLHEQGIIHADVKSSNCLLFGENVKVSDFTLSVLKLSPNDTFKRSSCTLPFCPPEVILNQAWCESIDIWSLGCTFYNIWTDSLLIPAQIIDSDPKMNKDEARKLYRGRTLAAIIKWRKSQGDNISKDIFKDYKDPIPRDERDFIPVVFNERWKLLPEEFRVLILKMTHFDPFQRPTIKELVEDPYFRGLKLYPTYILSTPYVQLDSRIELQIERKVGRGKGEVDAILRLTKELYSRSSEMVNDVSHPLIKIEACYWIASKLIIGLPPANVVGAKHLITDMELKICTYLDYRLHTRSKSCMFSKIIGV